MIEKLQSWYLRTGAYLLGAFWFIVLISGTVLLRRIEHPGRRLVRPFRTEAGRRSRWLARRTSVS